MISINDILSNPTDFIAALALVTSIASIIIGFWGLWIQRKHNILSVKPIAAIGINDIANQIEITVVNNGTGPLIVKSIETLNNCNLN